MKYNYQEIGNRIVTERKKKGLTQANLLELLEQRDCHINRNTLSNLENGKISQEKISILVLTKIAEILDTNIYYLLGDSKHKTKAKETIWNTLRIRGSVADRIANYNDSEIGMLNSLICYGETESSADNLKKLLNAIYEYKLISISDKSSITIKNPVYNLNNTYSKKEDIEKYLKYNVISCLEDCLKDDYWITDWLKGLSTEMYLYKNDSDNSQIRKAIKENANTPKRKRRGEKK